MGSSELLAPAISACGLGAGEHLGHSEPGQLGALQFSCSTIVIVQHAGRLHAVRVQGSCITELRSCRS
jgi:hypothetical protein